MSGVKEQGDIDDDDVKFYMRRCVELARKEIGCTSTNPMVDYVIVKDGKVVGEGFHPKVGQPHAEVTARAIYCRPRQRAVTGSARTAARQFQHCSCYSSVEHASPPHPRLWPQQTARAVAHQASQRAVAGEFGGSRVLLVLKTSTGANALIRS